MSEIHNSDFIHLPSFEEYVMYQDFEQQVALIGFYRTFCKDRHERGDAHFDGRQGKFPAILGKIWTIDRTLYALNATDDAFENPADYLLVAAQLRDNEVKIDELDILHVHHVRSGSHHSIDKVIDADWHETAKQATVRMGNNPSVVTLDKNSTTAPVYSPSLPIK